MKRMNLGCGSNQPDGWDNVDQRLLGQRYVLFDGGVAAWTTAWDSANGDDAYVQLENYDAVVMHHVLNEICWPDLVLALTNVRSMLRDGGVLRVSVPNAVAAFHAWQRRDTEWFPTGDKAETIDEMLCGYLAWFGTNVTIFTPGLLVGLAAKAGFRQATRSGYRTTAHGMPEIIELDDRAGESLFMEFVR